MYSNTSIFGISYALVHKITCVGVACTYANQDKTHTECRSDNHGYRDTFYHQFFGLRRLLFDSY